MNLSKTTVIEKRFKVEDAYRVFTDELKIKAGIAAGLVHRDMWELLNRMRDVGAGARKPPEFTCHVDRLDFESRCGDVYFGYVYEFNAYTGEVCIDLEDGGNVQMCLLDVIGPGKLKNPEDMDEWAPWIRMDMDAIDEAIEEYSGLGVAESDIYIPYDSSDSIITLKYRLED